MKTPKDLSVKQCRALLSGIQNYLWLDKDNNGNVDWNADKRWSQDELELIAEAMTLYGLRPDDYDK